MKEHQIEQITTSSEFTILNRQRNNWRFGLSFLVLLGHLFFVGGIAYYYQWFGEKISEGSSIPIGIVATVAVILFMLISEGIYIWISDKRLDPLQHSVDCELPQVNTQSTEFSKGQPNEQ